MSSGTSPTEPAPDQMAADDPLGQIRNSFRSFQRYVVAATAPADALSTPLAPGTADLETGVAQQGDAQWSTWARGAFGRVRDQASVAAEVTQQRLSQVAERAHSTEWRTQVDGVRESFSERFEAGRTSAAAMTSSVQERFHDGLERGRSIDFSEQAKTLQRGMTRSFDTITSTASSASSSFQEGASTVASGSRQAFSSASERVSGAAQLAMDPARMMKFLGMFGSGVLLIIISLNCLPVLLVKPGLFAFFFTLGSVTMLGSFVVLNGFDSFFKALVKKEKLPFSSAYVVSTLGTLYTTLIAKHAILTAVFAIIEVLSLLYLVFSYMPGGVSFLNLVGRFGGSSVRNLAFRS